MGHNLIFIIDFGELSHLCFEKCYFFLQPPIESLKKSRRLAIHQSSTFRTVMKVNLFELAEIFIPSIKYRWNRKNKTTTGNKTIREPAII